MKQKNKWHWKQGMNCVRVEMFACGAKNLDTSTISAEQQYQENSLNRCMGNTNYVASVVVSQIHYYIKSQLIKQVK